MFDLPSCPYCKRRSDYRESKGFMHSKNAKCRRCGKISAVKYKAACVRLAVLLAAALIGLNTLIFFKGNNKTLLPNLIVTVTAIVAYLLITPFKVKLEEIAGQRDDEHHKLKKNRHRHKKTKYKDVSFEDHPLKGTSFDN